MERHAGGRRGKAELTDGPYGDRLSPMGEELLRSGLTKVVGGDAGKVNSTKPFQGLPMFVHVHSDSTRELVSSDRPECYGTK